MPTAKLSVIVVNWNTRDLLLDCLESIARADYGPDLEVLVMDNASSDASVESVRAYHPAVRIHVNESNIGFAAANNVGIQMTHGEYILLLNSDALLPDGKTMRAWIAHMDSHPRAAASGCRLVYLDGHHQVGDAGFRPTIGTVLNHSLFLARLGPRRFPGIFLSGIKAGPPLAVDWVCGAGLLLRRSSLDRVGLMDQSYFMFAEDIEWGCRMRAAGYEVHYLPEHQLTHVQRGSTVKREGSFHHLWLRNLRQLYRTYNPQEPQFLFDAAMGLGFALRIVLYSLAYLGTADPRSKRRIRELSGYLRSTLHGKATGGETRWRQSG